MVQDAESLTLGDRLARIRKVVEAMPDGDQDKADLILFFDELDKAIEQRHQYKGALDTARWALEVALEKISKQKVELRTAELLLKNRD
jgi:hypothetical protein